MRLPDNRGLQQREGEEGDRDIVESAPGGDDGELRDGVHNRLPDGEHAGGAGAAGELHLQDRADAEHRRGDQRELQVQLVAGGPEPAVDRPFQAAAPDHLPHQAAHQEGQGRARPGALLRHPRALAQEEHLHV